VQQSAILLAIGDTCLSGRVCDPLREPAFRKISFALRTLEFPQRFKLDSLQKRGSWIRRAVCYIKSRLYRDSYRRTTHLAASLFRDFLLLGFSERDSDKYIRRNRQFRNARGAFLLLSDTLGGSAWQSTTALGRTIHKTIEADIRPGKETGTRARAADPPSRSTCDDARTRGRTHTRLAAVARIASVPTASAARKSRRRRASRVALADLRNLIHSAC